MAATAVTPARQAAVCQTTAIKRKGLQPRAFTIHYSLLIIHYYDKERDIKIHRTDYSICSYSHRDSSRSYVVYGNVAKEKDLSWQVFFYILIYFHHFEGGGEGGAVGILA